MKFDLKKMFEKNEFSDLKMLADFLKTDPKKLKEFETAYQEKIISDQEMPENLFDVFAKQASGQVRKKEEIAYDEEYLKTIMERIVSELIYSLDKDALQTGLPENLLVTNQMLQKIPEEVRPQLTGSMYKKDIVGEPSYRSVMFFYKKFLEETNPKKKKFLYEYFRGGLDVMDLDPVLYKVLERNRTSIGHWFPAVKAAAEKHGFFKIPETKIIKVPLPILQLTRLDYFSLTPSTLKIVDDFCMEAFGLDVNKKYFIKTGTYSSKYDFRNAKVEGEKEVRELGEYLLFIHYQANCMAHLTNKPTPIYGVSTTNEWCVREYIEDVESNPCIYKGMPLHTEYRIFIDCDSDEILGVSPYWRPDVMKARFEKGSIAGSPHDYHDYVIYLSHENVLMERYENNVDRVVKEVGHLLPDLALTGQWSLDVMQNGDDFYIIDMAPAENSALSDCVPKEKLRPVIEDWLPKLGGDVPC